MELTSGISIRNSIPLESSKEDISSIKEIPVKVNVRGSSRANTLQNKQQARSSRNTTPSGCSERHLDLEDP